MVRDGDKDNTLYLLERGLWYVHRSMTGSGDEPDGLPGSL